MFNNTIRLFQTAIIILYVSDYFAIKSSKCHLETKERPKIPRRMRYDFYLNFRKYFKRISNKNVFILNLMKINMFYTALILFIIIVTFVIVRTNFVYS